MLHRCLRAAIHAHGFESISSTLQNDKWRSKPEVDQQIQGWILARVCVLLSRKCLYLEKWDPRGKHCLPAG